MEKNEKLESDMRHTLELRPELELLKEKVQSLPPSGDGLRLAPLMDIFVSKSKPK